MMQFLPLFGQIVDVTDVGEGALPGVTAAIGAGLAIFAAIFVIGVAKKALHTAS